MGSLLSLVSAKREEDCDEISENEYTEMDSESDDMAMDAAKTNVTRRQLGLFEGAWKYSQDPITESRLAEIEGNLETYEKVSLIYLLYDEPNTGLQHMRMVVEDKHYKILSEWAKHEEIKDDKWQDKLLEALSIIQNYQVLRKLGFCKKQMYDRFLPLRKTTAAFVNPIRKCLYRICEDFKNEDVKQFLTHAGKYITVVPDYIASIDTYLEMYLLYLETENYMSCGTMKNKVDVTKIIKICKYMELDNLQNDLEKLSSVKNPGQKSECLDLSENPKREHDNSDSSSECSSDRFALEEFLNIDKTTPGKNKSLTKKKIKSTKSQGQVCAENVAFSTGDGHYRIDPNDPGILIIINNKHFYSEFNKDLTNFLPSRQQLEEREGTEVDKNNLEKTFQAFGFKVICFNDLIHSNILKKVQQVVAEIKNESSLFLAILSHGTEGIVYGSNSIGVKVMEIQNIMRTSSLAGKPKILILQSCQGSECQDLNDDLTTDGPANILSVPKTADMLVFWATVPGYGAIRHKKAGSWFVQTLCKKMQENQTSHFQDICVFVQREVTEKRWNHKVMVPLVESTLSKFLYLPNLNS